MSLLLNLNGYSGILMAEFEQVNVGCIVETAPHFKEEGGGGGEFSKFCQKEGRGSEFSHKGEGSVKYGRLF